ncbi:hypothetical protein CH254_12020 [Rhodococcus sp. 06-412-2C]|uniref:DUF4328 domain-containing protein n=1 Tax=unclassified Rhodococcus (in: high G+C Gram-positive bacteria) TaxID=192944 RepID=UPI000B9AF5CD|nr:MULTISPECIES: DUF4328 domain-containing protein [unclassified Rhodococcus (in: high G+C Gram-positive bacteria)]OZC88615.1 hypothetical protein CH254_12020 [Rhodococcus sp. 06-412-2C]OZD02980.1 hypothetical protein CH279_01550 [Rhodococcus sp. 06-412-2B]
MTAPRGRAQAFQVCARCSTRWAVGARPGTWCPRCHGVLLSPVSTQAPAQGRRNFRWVARPATSRSTAARTTRTAAPTPTPTPHYDSTPTWRLRDIPRDPAASRPVGRVEQYAANAQLLVVVTALLLALGAFAEVFRYGILLYNRTRLVSPITLAVSDALVYFAQVGSLVVGLFALIGSSCWLIRQRRLAFAAAGATDPRSVRWMLLLSMLPLVRIVMPGVYLTELARLRGDTEADVHRELFLVRIWWGVWAASNALVVVQLLWNLQGSLQARADGVLLSAVVAAVAAGSAVLTLAVMRRFEGRTLRGSALARPTRWVMATGNKATDIEATGPERSKEEPAEHEAVTAS